MPPTFLTWSNLWPGMPVQERTQRSSFRYNGSRDYYQIPIRHALLGTGKCLKTTL